MIHSNVSRSPKPISSNFYEEKFLMYYNNNYYFILIFSIIIIIVVKKNDLIIHWGIRRWCYVPVIFCVAAISSVVTLLKVTVAEGKKDTSHGKVPTNKNSTGNKKYLSRSLSYAFLPCFLCPFALKRNNKNVMWKKSWIKFRFISYRLCITF